MNIKFKKGKTRTVLVLGPIMIKFILLDPIIAFIRDIFSLIGHKNYFETLGTSWELYRFRIIRSIFANLTEFFTWKTLKPSFLAPTYFSCGFFNIQKTEIGESVNCFDLIGYIIDNLPEHRKHLWEQVEAHTLYGEHWLKTDRGYICFDYADVFMNQWPLSDLLKRNYKNIEIILKKYEKLNTPH